MIWNARWVAAACLPLMLGCPEAAPVSDVEESLGPIDNAIDEISKTVWPGNVRDDGQRYVRLLNGFFDGVPTAYWFAGFASRRAADVFWFCREGDEACPLDNNGVVDRERTVGDPVFARVLGESGYSPFWLIWVVRVPADYEPNQLKSVHGIQKAAEAKEVQVERVIYDHGGDVGPDAAIMHCLLVLEGTTLEGNGESLVAQPGVPSMALPVRSGWHKRYSVKFFEFTPSDGVFPPDPASESVPLMPSSDIFVFFRDCAAGSNMPPCQQSSGLHGAVSERGVEVDLTNDGDKADNNNIIAGFPRTPAPHPDDRVYSPLWKVSKVRVNPAHDRDIKLIDLTEDQDDTMIKDLRTMGSLVQSGMLEEPEFISEEGASDQVPGNDGLVFFNCPSQVAAE